MLDAIRVPRPGGRGRPRTRPDRVIGDKGYSYEQCRQVLRQRELRFTILERDDHRERRAHRLGRKPAFDRATYRRRNVVERGINRLKQSRAIATRYAKRGANYWAMVVIASILLWTGS